MEEENGAVVLLVCLVLFGGVLFLQTINMMGILVILGAIVVFFGAMLVAGENSDFDAIHEW